MSRRMLVSIALLCLSLSLWAGNPDTCFVSSMIPDSVFNKMQGRSYKAGCPIQRTALRYLRLSYRDATGATRTGELICNKAIASDLVSVFRELWKADCRIERMQLVDDYEASDVKSMQANNTSCFNYRTVAGSKSISKHGYGMAIDVNPLYNPYVAGKYVSPKKGKKWAYNRHEIKNNPYLIKSNSKVCQIFKAHGFRWGGDWKTKKDYQHFEK